MSWLKKKLLFLKTIKPGKFVTGSRRQRSPSTTVVPEIQLAEEIGNIRLKNVVLDGLFDRKVLKSELAELDRYADEFDPSLDKVDSKTFAWKGGSFTQCDAMAYYCFIRRYQPSTIVEFGSGWSTLVATEALNRNGKGRLVSIDTSPPDFLRDLQNLEIIEERIQDIDSDLCNKYLEEGDILFINSATKENISSYVHTYLRILPNVQNNIFVHIPDMHLPNKPPLIHPRYRKVSWTEQYLLCAYMTDNPRTRILYGTQYNIIRHKQAMESFMRGRYSSGGTSLWISHAKRTPRRKGTPHKGTVLPGCVCPICGGSTFQDYHTRPIAQCSTCKSLERGRALWFAMQKLGVPRSEDRILHMAPERFIMDRFGSTFGDRYVAADISPQIYNHPLVQVQKLDLCNDLATIPDASFDFILHNHVLEHLPCDVGDVLRQFDRILRPGGTMLFTVPTRAIDHTIEDISADLSREERLSRFAQEDHMRIFGRDVVQIVHRALGQDCFIPMDGLYSEEEAKRANMPWNPQDEPTGSSIFRYLKM